MLRENEDGSWFITTGGQSETIPAAIVEEIRKAREPKLVGYETGCPECGATLAVFPSGMAEVVGGEGLERELEFVKDPGVEEMPSAVADPDGRYPCPVCGERLILPDELPRGV